MGNSNSAITIKTFFYVPHLILSDEKQMKLFVNYKGMIYVYFIPRDRRLDRRLKDYLDEKMCDRGIENGKITKEKLRLWYTEGVGAGKKISLSHGHAKSIRINGIGIKYKKVNRLLLAIADMQEKFWHYDV